MTMNWEDGKEQRDRAFEEMLRRVQQQEEAERAKRQAEEAAERAEEMGEAETVEEPQDAEADAGEVSSDEKAKQAFEKLTGMDDEDAITVNFRTIIGGDVLAGRWFRRQLKFLLFLVGLAILYVSNRYACQRETIENIELTHKLEDRRLRAVVATSNLTEFTRRSNIQSKLQDSTLKSSPAPFYYLQTNQ